MMKCPGCQGSSIIQEKSDPLLYSCPDCFYFCSGSYLTGFWTGYYQYEADLRYLEILANKENKNENR